MTVPYDRHVFVCTNQRPPDHPRGSCGAAGGDALRARLKDAVKAAGLADTVRVNGAGCLDFCHLAACVVVYPDNVWYAKLVMGDVDELVASHLKQGVPLARVRASDAVLTAKKPWQV